MSKQIENYIPVRVVLNHMVKFTEIISTDVDFLKSEAAKLQVHPLALEDCLNKDQRPKLEDFGHHQLLVWFMLINGKIFEIQFLIFENQILMVPHEKAPKNTSWKEFLKINTDQKDCAHLLYHILDKMTDITWTEFREIFSEIDLFEEQMFKSESNPQKLILIKKKLNKADYSISHLASVSEQLQNFLHRNDDLNWKLRDLHDHCERIYNNISMYRNQISSMIDLYWGLEANRTNKQIKKLSILASVTVPVTLWSSIWGMNFEVIPFKSEIFFLFALAIMLFSVGVAIWLLIRKGYWEH